MELTKYKKPHSISDGWNLGETARVKGLPQPPLELEIDPYKPIIDLTPPSKIEICKIDLRNIIEGRRSVREYHDEPLTLEEISWLLWCTQGVKRITERPATIRTVPSAGARHPFETYLLVNRITGLEPGLYRFIASQHKLQVIELEETLIDKIADANWSAQMIKNSAVTFIWVAVRYRMTHRYGDRSFRYLHLDAGHVCQNLYLAAEAVHCGTCAIGGFLDDKVNELLNLDGQEQFVIYMASVGKNPH